MKTLRRIFFILFISAALISVNMLYNLLGGRLVSVGLLSEAVVPLVYIAVQLAGLIVVIFSRNRILTGLFSILAGIATILSGFFAAPVFNGATSQHIVFINTLMTSGVSHFVFAGYIILGAFFFAETPDKENK